MVADIHVCTFSLWPVSYNYLINTDSAIFPFQVSMTAPINNPSKRTKSTAHGFFFKYIENGHSLLLDVSSVENFPVLMLYVSAPLIPAVVDSPQMVTSRDTLGLLQRGLPKQSHVEQEVLVPAWAEAHSGSLGWVGLQ